MQSYEPNLRDLVDTARQRQFSAAAVLDSFFRRVMMYSFRDMFPRTYNIMASNNRRAGKEELSVSIRRHHERV